MTISPLAGKPAPKDMLIDVARLDREYFSRRPDLDVPEQLVSFGTSGHRGSPLRGSFTRLTFSQSPRRSVTIGGPMAPMARFSIVSLTCVEQNQPGTRCALTRPRPHRATGSPPRLGRSGALSARRDGVGG